MGKVVRSQHPVLLLPDCIVCNFLAQGGAKLTLYSHIHWFKKSLSSNSFFYSRVTTVMGYFIFLMIYSALSDSQHHA